MGTARRPRAKHAGFTLLELVFALTVLAVALASAFASQMGSLDLLRTSRETSIAAADMQAAFERLYAEPSSELPLAGSDFQSGQPVAAFDGLHLQNQQIVATYPNWGGGAAPVPNPLEVRLTMTWNDFEGRPRQMIMRTMVAQ